MAALLPVLFRVSDAGRLRDSAAYSAAGVRKPPRKETALGGRKECRERYGDLKAAGGV
jgi:hypothetical protein